MVQKILLGLLFSYVAPLVFVMGMTLLKEGWDDAKRYIRDKESNTQGYRKLHTKGLEKITAAEIKVGDVIEVVANQRIPADLILLFTK